MLGRQKPITPQSVDQCSGNKSSLDLVVKCEVLFKICRRIHIADGPRICCEVTYILMTFRCQGGSEPFEHWMSHSYINPGFRTFRGVFVVLAEPSVSAQPSQGALHNPPTVRHLEARAVLGPLDHLNQPAPQGGSPMHELSGIGAVGPNNRSLEKRP